MSQRALRLLGLMKKANAIEPGETKTGAAAKAKKAVLLVLAGDSSDNALHRITNFSLTNSVPMVRVPYTKQEIADTIGADVCSMFAVKDAGFARAFLEAVLENTPEIPELPVILEQLTAQHPVKGKERQKTIRKIKKED